MTDPQSTVLGKIASAGGYASIRRPRPAPPIALTCCAAACQGTDRVPLQQMGSVGLILMALGRALPPSIRSAQCSVGRLTSWCAIAGECTGSGYLAAADRGHRGRLSALSWAATIVSRRPGKRA